MDRATQSGEGAHPPPIIIAPRTLLVLCGPAGCGKSTFAQRLIDSHRGDNWQPTLIVSSDVCRGLICDDEANQQINRDAFDLLYYIISKRLFQNRLTVADSTALQADPRHRLQEIARRYNFATCLLIFDVSLETCLRRDRQRRRQVGEQVILYHMGLLKQALIDAPNEDWNQIVILKEQDINTQVIVR